MIKRWLLKTRLKSLEKVRQNALKEGWPTVEHEVRVRQREIRRRLAE